MPSQGTLHTSADGRSLVRFERQLDHPLDKVWRAISEPAEMKHWFPMAVEFSSFSVGGGMRFVDEQMPPFEGKITELDPPQVLAFTWGPDLLRLELSPRSSGCLLVLTHTFADDGIKAARDGAGWHVCLDLLEASLANQQVGWSSQQRWQELHPGYVEAMGGRTMTYDEARESGRSS
jgi:uncharacterized protein YndB with AHSA1/START domain